MDRRFRVAINVVVPAMLLMPGLALAQNGPTASATLPPPIAAAPLPALPAPVPAPQPEHKPAAPTPHPAAAPPHPAAATPTQLTEARAHALLRKPRPTRTVQQATQQTRRSTATREATGRVRERRGVIVVERLRRPQIASAWPGTAVPPPYMFYDGPPVPYGPYGGYGPRYRYPRRWARSGPWY
jgi:hypothetical protein